MLSQRAREITARDFAAVAAGSSLIQKQHFPQLLERHLLRQPTTSEVAIMTRQFGESGLQLDSWLQWVEHGLSNHTGCVEQRSETGLPEGIGQTQADLHQQNLAADRLRRAPTIGTHSTPHSPPAALPAPAEAENMEPVDPARPYASDYTNDALARLAHNDGPDADRAGSR